MKKLIQTLLICALMLFALSVTALAATEGYYTYIVSNGEATIFDVDTSISGNVTIPSTLGGYPVTVIGDNAFRYCENLTNIVISDSITIIGTAAFEHCTGLTSVIIGDNVTIVGPAAFQYCKNLITTVIPDSVTTIGRSAFNDCNSLTSVIIGKGITTIEKQAFYYCNSLKNVYYTGSNTQWENISLGSDNGYLKEEDITYNSTLGKTEDLVYVEVNNEIVIFVSNGDVSGELNIPSIINNYPVTKIGDKAFYNCNGLTGAVVPDSVTEIGEEVFYGCSSLEKISVPFVGKFGYLFGSRKYSGSYEASSSFETYYLPSNLKKVVVTNDEIISYMAFYNCNSLTSIDLGDNVTEIGDLAFYGCTKLTNVMIGSSVIKIGNSAFYNCNRLTSIEIPKSVTEIGRSAFCGCTKLTNVTIPDSVEVIGDMVFSGCSALEEITMPFIGSERGNSGMADASFGYIFGTSSYTDSYEAKQYYNSSECQTYYIPISLKKVTVTDEKVIPYGAFSECKYLTDIIIDGNPTAIMANSFTGFYNLFNVVINTQNVRYASSNIFKGSDFPTMYGYTGSTTEDYAKNYNVEFVPLDYYGEYTLLGNAKSLNGKIVVNVKVSDKVKDKHLHIALYDDNEKQIDYMIVPTQEPFDEINVVFADNKSAKSAKLFLWESLTSITPISASVETEIIR